MREQDIPTNLRAYEQDLTDDTIIYRDPGDGYSIHSYVCTCGECRPVTQAEATTRELKLRGLWSN